MTVVGVSMVKDEADIIGDTLDWMLGQVDAVIVADNCSQDGTAGTLLRYADQHGRRVLVEHDPEVAYYQAAKMTRLARLAARRLDAEWVVPFDADEIWRAPGGHRLADWLEEQPGNVAVAEALLFDHVATGSDDPAIESPVRRMAWRRQQPVRLPKVAFRPFVAAEVAMGNHSVSYPAGARGGLEVRHFQNRSVEQFIRKVRNGAAAYAASDLPETYGAHWRLYGRLTDEQLASHYVEHFWVEAPERAGTRLVRDPV